ncbi:hypothetical protein CYMTET_56898 [Cymbomonas tetramitiformis]|uniref:PHD-type domain-containing protein n=1 Tax=Cymbomonas tetramitiformis TaxID=36881 RepID=A0AAE0BAD3_9CHLO|nr:hypothetical protein CYMTET_56898 [Cymbomonas tetramitiformis]
MKVPGLVSWKLLESTRLEINSVTQAFSELVDNTRDVALQHNKKFSFWIDFRFAPGSSRVPSEIHCWDDGPGVPREQVQEMLGFGFSDKGADLIGQYGLGVKHACMRLARSTLIFIKTAERAVVLLMSPTFLESKGIKEIEYPECEFDKLLGKYCLRHTHIGTAEDIIAHSSLESVDSMVSILENMPRTGIKYVMYQLRESKEMDIGTDPSDLVVMNADGSRRFTQARPGQAYSALLREDYSLRRYLEVLYQGTPLVNIHLRGQRVTPRDPHAMLKEQVQRFRLEVSVPTETGAGASIHNASVHVAELSLGYTDDATARHLMEYPSGNSGRAPMLGGVNMYSKNRLCQLYMRIGLQLFNTHRNVGKDILGVLSADFLTLNRSKTAFAQDACYSRLQEAIKEAMHRYHANMQTRSTAGVKAGTRRIPLHPGVEVIRVPKQRGRVITGDGALPHQPALGSVPVQQNTGHRKGSCPREACEGKRAPSEPWRMPASGAHGVPRGCAGDGGNLGGAAVRGCTMNVGSGRTRGAEGILTIYNNGRDAQCEIIVSHDASSGKYVTYCKEWGQAVVWCICGLPSIGSMIQCSICDHWEHALCAGYAADADAADLAGVIYSCHLCRAEHCISEADFRPRPLHRQQGRPERTLVLAIQFALEDLTEWDERLRRAKQQLLDSRTLSDICQELLCLEQLLPANAKPTSWGERRAATWRATVQRAESPDALWEAAAQLLQERLAFLPMPVVAVAAASTPLAASALHSPAASNSPLHAHAPDLTPAHAPARASAHAPTPAYGPARASAHAPTPDHAPARASAHAPTPAYAPARASAHAPTPAYALPVASASRSHSRSCPCRASAHAPTPAYGPARASAHAPTPAYGPACASAHAPTRSPLHPTPLMPLPVPPLTLPLPLMPLPVPPLTLPLPLMPLPVPPLTLPLPLMPLPVPPLTLPLPLLCRREPHSKAQAQPRGLPDEQAVPPRERVPTAVEEIACEVCGLLDDDPAEGWDMLLCDSCPTGWHLACLTPPLLRPREGEWACPRCSSGEVVRAPSSELVERQVRFVGSAGELLRGATGVCHDFVEAGGSSRAMYVVKLDVGVRFPDGITDTIIGVQDQELLVAVSGMPGPSQGWVTTAGTGVGVQRMEPAPAMREDVLVTCGGMRGYLSSGTRQHEETVLCRIRSSMGGVGLVQLSPGSFRRLAGSGREDMWWGDCLMHALTKQPIGAWLRARGGGYARIGQRLSVFWSIDDMYYSGRVAKYREHDAAHLLHYDDGEEEWVNLALQILKWESEGGATTQREAEPSAGCGQAGGARGHGAATATTASRATTSAAAHPKPCKKSKAGPVRTQGDGHPVARHPPLHQRSPRRAERDDAPPPRIHPRKDAVWQVDEAKPLPPGTAFLNRDFEINLPGVIQVEAWLPGRKPQLAPEVTPDVASDDDDDCCITKFIPASPRYGESSQRPQAAKRRLRGGASSGDKRPALPDDIKPELSVLESPTREVERTLQPGKQHEPAGVGVAEDPTLPRRGDEWDHGWQSAGVKTANISDCGGPRGPQGTFSKRDEYEGCRSPRRRAWLSEALGDILDEHHIIALQEAKVDPVFIRKLGTDKLDYFKETLDLPQCTAWLVAKRLTPVLSK